VQPVRPLRDAPLRRERASAGAGARVGSSTSIATAPALRRVSLSGPPADLMARHAVEVSVRVRGDAAAEGPDEERTDAIVSLLSISLLLESQITYFSPPICAKGAMFRLESRAPL